jgi:hypothetical protein
MMNIINCIGSLSLYPKGSDLGAVCMGMTCNGSPLLCTILKDSTDEFYMTSSGEGSSSFPISQSHSMGTPPAPLATTPWQEDALIPQTMAMDLPQTIALSPDNELPLERWYTVWERQQA